MCVASSLLHSLGLTSPITPHRMKHVPIYGLQGSWESRSSLSWGILSQRELMECPLDLCVFGSIGVSPMLRWVFVCLADAFKSATHLAMMLPASLQLSSGM